MNNERDIILSLLRIVRRQDELLCEQGKGISTHGIGAYSGTDIVGVAEAWIEGYEFHNNNRGSK